MLNQANPSSKYLDVGGSHLLANKLFVIYKFERYCP